MTTPIISIIIPSREREATLACCLRAMKHHTSQDIEIVVIDTSRMGTARDVVHQAAASDSRIRYVAAPHSTSQRHSFEIGLAEAKGDYLGIIGDDDGYVIGSIDWLAEKLRHVQVDAVRWNFMTYIWPSLSVDGEGFFDVHPGACKGGTEIRPTAPMAGLNVIGRMPGSQHCLLVYHGMISRRVYEKMKASTDGVFFCYPMMDVYAHNLLPFYSETYLQMDCVVSIYGQSGSSAAASWYCGLAEDDEKPLEASRWIRESLNDPVAHNQPWHPELRTLRYHDYTVLRKAEASGFLGDHVIDHKAWLAEILQEIKDYPWQLDNWLTLEPKAPFDPEIIAAVRSQFANHTDRPKRAVSILRSPSEHLPSMRIGKVLASLPDDIEGAMLATRMLLGPHNQFLEGIAKSQLPAAVAMTTLQKCMRSIRTTAPSFVRNILNSPIMPSWLWRLLFRLYTGQPSDLISAQKQYAKMAHGLSMTGDSPVSASSTQQTSA